MPQKTLHRRHPAGHGLETLLGAYQQSGEPSAITNPPEDLEALKADGSDSFTLASFTVEDALELGHLLHARLHPYALASQPTVISIALSNWSQVLFHTVTGPGTAPDNEGWVRRKRASVLRFGGSTWGLHLKFGGDEKAFAAKYGFAPEQAGGYAIHGGGVPIRVEGVEGVVAVVVVSGLKQHEDHGVISDVIRENWQ